MSKSTPEQTGQRLINSATRKTEQYLADLDAERQSIIDDDLSREALIELLAVARVNLRNAKADSEAQRQQHHVNFSAGWDHSDRLAVKRERKNTQGQSGKNKDKAKAVAWIRRLPCQVDSSKLETSCLNTLGLNAAGGTSPRDSWGRYSL